MIYGLDLSLTATGLAALDQQNQLTVGKFGTPAKMQVEARLIELAGQVARRIVAPELVVMEGLAMGAKKGLPMQLAALHYLVRCNLWSDETSVLVVAPSALKKFVTGKGSSQKDVMLKEMFRRFGLDTNDNNEADAAGLAYLGLAFLGRLDAMTVPMREVVSRLKEVR